MCRGGGCGVEVRRTGKAQLQLVMRERNAAAGRGGVRARSREVVARWLQAAWLQCWSRWVLEAAFLHGLMSRKVDGRLVGNGGRLGEMGRGGRNCPRDTKPARGGGSVGRGRRREPGHGYQARIRSRSPLRSDHGSFVLVVQGKKKTPLDPPQWGRSVCGARDDWGERALMRGSLATSR